MKTWLVISLNMPCMLLWHSRFTNRRARLDNSPVGRLCLHVRGSSGQYLLAAPFGSTLYRSADGGSTWSSVTSVTGVLSPSQLFRAVSINAEGDYMAAVIGDFSGSGAGPLLVSSNYGVNWTAATSSASTTPPTFQGISVAISLRHLNSNTTSGAIWAAAQNGQVYRYLPAGSGFYTSGSINVNGGSNGDWRDIATDL